MRCRFSPYLVAKPPSPAEPESLVTHPQLQPERADSGRFWTPTPALGRFWTPTPAFADYPNWQRSESALRELRKKVTFAIFAESEDLEAVTRLVESLFALLDRASRI